MADTVVLTQGPFAYSDGGEFTAVTTPTLADLGAYSPYTSTATSFQTFCVQDTTDFQPGVSYYYTLSSISLGGPGFPGGNVGVGSPNSYPLSEGTAWLYSQFALGTLGGYDFANTLSDRQTDAGLLQSAIWALQGGQVDPGYPSGTAGNIYYTEALAALGANLNTAATKSTDFGVQIMNLMDADGGNYQNQLIYTGVPDGGATVALLGLGLAGLAGFSRKSSASKRSS